MTQILLVDGRRSIFLVLEDLLLNIFISRWLLCCFVISYFPDGNHTLQIHSSQFLQIFCFLYLSVLAVSPCLWHFRNEFSVMLKNLQVFWCIFSMFLTSFWVWLHDFVLGNHTCHTDLKFVSLKLAILEFFWVEMVNTLQASE